MGSHGKNSPIGSHRFRGTQLEWDVHYKLTGKMKAEGLHIFNEGQTVVHLESNKRGRVMTRDALTATIEWEGGHSEVIHQFNREVSVFLHTH